LDKGGGDKRKKQHKRRREERKMDTAGGGEKFVIFVVVACVASSFGLYWEAKRLDKKCRERIDCMDILDVLFKQICKEHEKLRKENALLKEQLDKQQTTAAAAAADMEHSVLKKVVEVFADTLDEISENSSKQQTPLVDTD
jgi:hypothetical protein